MSQPPDERRPMPWEEPSTPPPDEQPTVAWTPPEEPPIDAAPADAPSVDAAPPVEPLEPTAADPLEPVAPAPLAEPTVPADPALTPDPQSPLISWAPSAGAAAGAAGAAGTTPAIVGWESPDASVPPSGVAGYQTAGVGARLVAWIFDGFLVLLVAGVLFGLLAAIVGTSIVEDAFVLNALFIIIVLGLEFLYFVGFWTAGAGATPGMRLLGLRIVSSPGGGAYEIGPAIKRWVAFGYPLSILSLVPVLGSFASYALTGWTIVLLLTTAMSDTNQGLHDRFGGSAIVRRIGASNNTALIGCLVIAFILIGLFVVLPILALIAIGPQLEEILSEIGESI